MYLLGCLYSVCRKAVPRASDGGGPRRQQDNLDSNSNAVWCLESRSTSLSLSFYVPQMEILACWENLTSHAKKYYRRGFVLSIVERTCLETHQVPFLTKHTRVGGAHPHGLTSVLSRKPCWACPHRSDLTCYPLPLGRDTLRGQAPPTLGISPPSSGTFWVCGLLSLADAGPGCTGSSHPALSSLLSAPRGLTEFCPGGKHNQAG